MEGITRSELLRARLNRASSTVKILSSEIEELRQRLSLVEIHNQELQDLIDRIGESAAQIAASIDRSMEGLEENMDFVFNEEESGEIASAEEFSQGGSVDVDFDFCLSRKNSIWRPQGLHFYSPSLSL